MLRQKWSSNIGLVLKQRLAALSEMANWVKQGVTEKF